MTQMAMRLALIMLSMVVIAYVAWMLRSPDCDHWTPPAALALASFLVLASSVCHRLGTTTLALFRRRWRLAATELALGLLFAVATIAAAGALLDAANPFKPC